MTRKTVYTLSALAVAAGLAGTLALAAPAGALAQGFGYGPGMGYAQNMGPNGGQQMANQGPCGNFGPANFQRGKRGSRGGHWGFNQNVDLQLTPEQAKVMAELRLKRWGNDNVKVGTVTQKDDNTIVVEIVTKDDSLVQRFEVDRKTGRPTPVK